MLTEEQAAIAYEEATDGCRSVFGTRDNAPQWRRVKPDLETHPQSEFDYEEGATWDEPLVTTPLLHLGSGRSDCIALAIQPPAISEQPTEKGYVAAM